VENSHTRLKRDLDCESIFIRHAVAPCAVRTQLAWREHPSASVDRVPTGHMCSSCAVTGRAAELTIPCALVAARSRLALAYAVPSLRHGWCPTATTSQLRLHSSDFTAPTARPLTCILPHLLIFKSHIGIIQIIHPIHLDSS
jgi:hypothetical protein